MYLRQGFANSQATFSTSKEPEFYCYLSVLPFWSFWKTKNSPELTQGHHRRVRPGLTDLCWQRWEDFCYLPAAFFQVHRAFPAERTTEVKMVDQEHEETSEFGRGHTTQANSFSRAWLSHGTSWQEQENWTQGSASKWPSVHVVSPGLPHCPALLASKPSLKCLIHIKFLPCVSRSVKPPTEPPIKPFSTSMTHREFVAQGFP